MIYFKEDLETQKRIDIEICILKEEILTKLDNLPLDDAVILCKTWLKKNEPVEFDEFGFIRR